jgi:hypothetical protein
MLLEDALLLIPSPQQNDARYVASMLSCFYGVVVAWPIAVACRIWRAKASCCPKTYHQKSQLAWGMVVDEVQQGLPIDYVVLDTLHTGDWLTNKFSRLELTSVGIFPFAIDTSAGQRQSWLIILR